MGLSRLDRKIQATARIDSFASFVALPMENFRSLLELLLAPPETADRGVASIRRRTARRPSLRLHARTITGNSGSRPCLDPGAHSATAPILPYAANAPVHGAQAKHADACAGA
ncbi:hypothetical protein GCM10011320_29850 [Neoroseomonas lacus]|uniref:Uncharacterized protein n=1 Tax=Neoroseomonas lacus TaxID=287609 RepID=A0A917KMG7_9PROT|nr:hypothetical protein GCM10011320_29850 [Neoroseomonas lacus]